jgi:hypothetical protein
LASGACMLALDAVVMCIGMHRRACASLVLNLVFVSATAYDRVDQMYNRNLALPVHAIRCTNFISTVRISTLNVLVQNRVDFFYSRGLEYRLVSKRLYITRIIVCSPGCRTTKVKAYVNTDYRKTA